MGLAPRDSASLLPRPFRVTRARRELIDVWTLELDASDGEDPVRFRPGQFTMVYVLGIGEVPLSISGDAALLFPIGWPEPFGLVMIEALACGTPVIAWRRGSVPEVLDDGVTGFIVERVPEAVDAVKRLGRLSRATCRRVFEDWFDARRMTMDYLDVYRRVGVAG